MECTFTVPDVRERVEDDADEEVDENEADDDAEEEEDEGSPQSVHLRHLLEVEVAEHHREHRLNRAHERREVAQEVREGQVRRLHERAEYDEKDEEEGDETSGCVAQSRAKFGHPP